MPRAEILLSQGMKNPRRLPKNVPGRYYTLKLKCQAPGTGEEFTVTLRGWTQIRGLDEKGDREALFLSFSLLAVPWPDTTSCRPQAGTGEDSAGEQPQSGLHDLHGVDLEDSCFLLPNNPLHYFAGGPELAFPGSRTSLIP